jgi:serine/threonine protein kinase
MVFAAIHGNPSRCLRLISLQKQHCPQGASISFIRKVAVQLLSSFAFLEGLGIIHADLKPENVLLCFQSSGFELPLTITSE